MIFKDFFFQCLTKGVKDEYIAKVSKYRDIRPDWNMQDKNVKPVIKRKSRKENDTHSVLPENSTQDNMISPQTFEKRAVSESVFQRRKAYEEKIRNRLHIVKSSQPPVVKQPPTPPEVIQQPPVIQKRNKTFDNGDRFDDLMSKLNPDEFYSIHQQRYQDFLKEVQSYYTEKKTSNPLKQEPLVSAKTVLDIQDDEPKPESTKKSYGDLFNLICCLRKKNKIEDTNSDTEQVEEEDDTSNEEQKSFQKMMEAHEDMNRRLTRTLKASMAFENKSDYQKRTHLNKGQEILNAEASYKDFKTLLDRHNTITSRFVIKEDE